MVTENINDFGFFTARREPPLLHITFRHNLFEHLSNLSNRETIAKFTRHVLEQRNVKVILLKSDFKESGCEAYARFIGRAKQNDSHLGIHRLMNITNQIIRRIMALDQLVIHVSQGNVLSLFFNISLACDYRIASGDTLFCNPYLDLGVIPLGGGPFFLSQMTGNGQALETLLLDRDIPAVKALEMGLVDRVVPIDELDRKTGEIAARFSRVSLKTIAGLKRLMNFKRQDIDSYFELEKKEMLRAVSAENVLFR